MNSNTLSTRVVLVALVGLLSQPIVEIGSPVAAKQRQGTVVRTFANRTFIDLPVVASNPASASNLYPSEIAVGGLKKGRIRDVNVRLNDLQHLYPDDVQALLVGPQGKTAILMADSGGGFRITDVTLTFDDEAQSLLPDQQMIQSGSFRPTNPGNLAIEFNEPAPVTSGNADLSVFDGGKAKGVWRLFLQDEIGEIDAGVLSGGWELEIEVKVKAKKKR